SSGSSGIPGEVPGGIGTGSGRRTRPRRGLTAAFRPTFDGFGESTRRTLVLVFLQALPFPIRVPPLYLLRIRVPVQRIDRIVPDRATAGVRWGKGSALGHLSQLRALEPDAARDAVGGDRGVRAGVPRDAAAGLDGEHRTCPSVGGARAGSDRRAAAAGVRGVALG